MDLTRPGAPGREAERVAADAERLAERALRPRPIRLVVGVVRSFLADDGLTWAAGIAFFLVLSIPPLLIGVAALTQVVTGRHDLVASILGQATRVIPGEGDTVRQLADGRGRDVAIAGLIALIWILVSGSRIFGVLVGALTAMWDVPRKGTLIERELLRVGLLFGALALLAIGSLVAALAVTIPPATGAAAALAGAIATQVVPLALVGVALSLLYLTVPPDKAKPRSAVVGAVVATLALRVVELVFLELVSASPGWQTVYGPLAGVALLMTWAFAASAAVVLGAEVTIVLERPDRLDPDGRGAPGAENREPEGRSA
jgi:membrane protein